MKFINMTGLVKQKEVIFHNYPGRALIQELCLRLEQEAPPAWNTLAQSAALVAPTRRTPAWGGEGPLGQPEDSRQRDVGTGERSAN